MPGFLSEEIIEDAFSLPIKRRKSFSVTAKTFLRMSLPSCSIGA